MSTREIAELTGKEHKHVMRDARVMLEELGEDQSKFGHISPDAYGRPQPVLNLPKDLTLTLVAGYSVPLRHRIVTRQFAKIFDSFRGYRLYRMRNQLGSPMEFLPFTTESYHATLQKWCAEADKYDAFPHEVERRLAWVKEAVSAGDTGSHRTIAYGVFQPGEQVAVCTCELVLSDRGQLSGKWLKLLNVTLSPEIDALIIDENFDAMTTAVHAYKTATLGAFNARLDHAAETLKLYGRTDAQFKFLMTLLAVLQDNQTENLESSKEGRWLVLRAKKGN